MPHYLSSSTLQPLLPTMCPYWSSIICREYSKTYARSKYYDEVKPWTERCDVAFPCASQNEIDQSDAINLVNSGCRILVEGSGSRCY